MKKNYLWKEKESYQAVTRLLTGSFETQPVNDQAVLKLLTGSFGNPLVNGPPQPCSSPTFEDMSRLTMSELELDQSIAHALLGPY